MTVGTENSADTAVRPFQVEIPKGGHFAAWEQPELFATEIRAAFKTLR